MPAERRRRSGIFLPFVILLLALAAWTGWWFYLVRQIEARIHAGAQDLRKAGYEVAYVDLRTTGWPFRAHVQADHVRITAPSGHAFAAPAFAAEANAYAPNHWVMAAPDGVVLTRGAKGRLAVRGRALRASLAEADAPIPRLVIEMLEPVFTPLEGAEPFPLASAERIDLHLRPHGEPDQAQFLFRVVEAQGRRDGVLDWVAQGEPFSSSWEGRVTRWAAFDGDGWAGSVRAWSAAGGALHELRGEARAGSASAEAASDRLTVGPDGRLQGVVALNLSQAPEALVALGRSQAVDPLSAGAAAAAAAAQGGMTGEVRMRLTFADGRTTLGPVPLAPAPRIY